MNNYTYTTQIAGKDVSKTINAVKRELVRGSAPTKEIDLSNAILVLMDEMDVRDFTQPVFFKHNDRSYCAVNSLSPIGEGKVRDRLLNAMKGYFFIQWLYERNLWKSTYSFAGRVFTRILSGTITRTYGLSPDQTMIIETVVADYYNQLLYQGDKPMDHIVRTSGIMRYSNATAKFAEKIAKQEVVYIKGIESLVDVIVKMEISPKLRNFSVSTLLTIMSGIIYGRMAKEDISISLEFPPMWTWLVYRTVTNVSFKNTILTKTVMITAKDRKSKFKDFSDTMLSNTKIVEENISIY